MPAPFHHRHSARDIVRHEARARRPRRLDADRARRFYDDLGSRINLLFQTGEAKFTSEVVSAIRSGALGPAS